ncbi:hypothetical protein EHLJMEHL_02201 [Vreelandella titanicae]
MSLNTFHSEHGFVSAAAFGAVGNGTTDDTAALQSAIDYLESVGGGKLVIPAGNYALSARQSSGQSSYDNISLHIKSDNIVIEGERAGAVTLRLRNNQNSHVITVGATNRITKNCTIRNISIDGNRANQTTPTSALHHNAGIYCMRLENSDLQNISVMNATYYGIGLENGDFINCSLDNVNVNNTGGDAIDFKNQRGGNSSNTLNNIRVSRWGQVAGITAQAGIDIRAGVTLTNAHVSLPGVNGAIGVRLRFEALGSEPSAIDGLQVHGGGNLTFGVQAQQPESSLSNLKVFGCTTGLRVSSREIQVAQALFRDCNDGIQINGENFGLAPTRCQFTNVIIRECDNTGFNVADSSAVNTFLSSVILHTVRVGLYIRANNLVWVGGEVSNASSANIDKANSVVYLTSVLDY